MKDEWQIGEMSHIAETVVATSAPPEADRTIVAVWPAASVLLQSPAVVGIITQLWFVYQQLYFKHFKK